MTTNTQTQLIRFAIVGILSNGLLYFVYLECTSAGVGHKLAMSSLYAVGIMQSFFLNNRWTFRNSGKTRRAFIRYCLAYGIGYALNLMALIALVDWVGLSHQLVQGVMIFLLAVFLFFLQKVWVFGGISGHIR